jgi:hypothetical protein
VNTLGLPIYAKQSPQKFDRGSDLHTQSNPLPMCLRPGVLGKVTAFDVVFEHLGNRDCSLLRCDSNASKLSLAALIKEPENVYEIDGSQVIEQVAEISVKSCTVTPKIGDFS